MSSASRCFLEREGEDEPSFNERLKDFAMRKLWFSKFPPVRFGQGCRLTIGFLAGERLGCGSSMGFSCKRGFIGLGLVFLSSVGLTSSGLADRPAGKEFLSQMSSI